MVTRKAGGMMGNKHEHYWSYMHTVWQGRDDRANEVGVVRYCSCGMKQMAFASRWQKPPREYDLDITELNPKRAAP